ncbi:uncharacterized protein LOC142635805 [Castanea sativa]|uniref:uncharacterized protein LOC142635805 n=1 Tax=Castanea sativa TaxID=21020 RepID=UPI003F6525B9
MNILSIAHEKSYVMMFLIGLNESFETMRSHILMLEPFPSMSKVYALVLQEESHKGIGHGSTFTPRPDSVAMYANAKGNLGNRGGPKKERPLCTHCNMLGHTVDKCYKLHKYPPGYKHKGKPNSNANQVSYPQGQVVEVPSNAVAQCPIFKAQCEQLLALFNSGHDQGANHLVASVSTSVAVFSMLFGVTGVPAAPVVPSTALTSSDSAHSPFVDTMSGNPLIPSLQHSIFSAKTVNRKAFQALDWVIDTGATDHMIHSIECLTTITSTLNTFVNLPNGEVASVTHIGIVKISKHLVLHNVLCVPSFSFNLISVSQLAMPTACCLIFLGTLCLYLPLELLNVFFWDILLGVKGYKVLDLSNNRVFLFRDVAFHEHSFPFASVSPFIADHFLHSDVAASCPTGIDNFVTPISISDPSSLEVSDSPSSSFQFTPNALPSSQIPSSSPIQVPVLDLVPSSPSPVASVPPMPLRKSARDIRPPAYLQDYACATIAAGAPYDIGQCLTYSHLEPCYHSCLLAVRSSPKEPATFSQAVQDPLWRAAMDKEIQALDLNHTWVVTTLPPDKTPIEFTKSSLTQMGVLKDSKLVRVLLALAATKQWPLHQLDINNAFLHRDLDEEVYMTLPPGFHSKGECVSASSTVPKVCKLVKSLYGLRQASSKGSLFTALLVYVGDMVITGNDLTCVASFKSVLDSKFGIQD